MSTPILRLRDQNGNVFDVLALIGPKGDKGDPGVGMDNITLADVTDGNGKTLGVILDELWQSDASMADAVGAKGYLGSLPNGTDVSTLTTNGWYMINPSYTYANLPAERTNWGVLEIKDKVALLYEMNTGRVFFSYLLGMSPTPWTEFFTTTKMPTPAQIGAVAKNGGCIGGTLSDLDNLKESGSWTWLAPEVNPFGAMTGALFNVLVECPYYGEHPSVVQTATQTYPLTGKGRTFRRMFYYGSNDWSEWKLTPTIHQSTAAPTAADGVDGDVWHQYV